MKRLISKYYQYLLRTVLWGIVREMDTPPEFVVTEHAIQRMEERGLGHLEPLHAVHKAWGLGKMISPSEKITRMVSNKPLGFQSMVYKKYGSNVFVFGIKRNKKIYGRQKWLITVLEDR